MPVDAYHYYRVYNLIQSYGGRRKFLAFLKRLSKEDRKTWQKDLEVKNALFSRDFLSREHEPLIFVSLRKKLSHSEITSEVIQQGRINLLRAIESFDPNKGYAFSTFALKILSFTCKDIYDNSSLIKLPQKIKALEKLLKENNYSNSDLISKGFLLKDILVARNFYSDVLLMGNSINIIENYDL